MRKCSLENLNAVFNKISEEMTLFVPALTETGAEYRKWEEGVTLSNKLNTNKSPKDFFFPQVENLMEFKVNGKEIEEPPLFKLTENTLLR